MHLKLKFVPFAGDAATKAVAAETSNFDKFLKLRF